MATTRDGEEGAPRATSRFEAQHKELSNLGKALLQLLDTRTLTEDAAPARRALATFSGRLRVHASMEQEALYPRLLESGDPQVVAKARALLGEVGALYEDFFGLMRRWAELPAIQGDPEGFAREVMAMLHKLNQRMRRENQELYPLVNALDKARPGA